NPTEEIIVDPEKFLQFIFCPNVKGSLGKFSVLVDAIGVECAVKSTVRIGEFPCYEIQRFSDDSKIKLIFREFVRIGVQRDQLAVVVQHFFEMRHVPSRIDGISGKSAADGIEKSAPSHTVQCHFYLIENLRIIGLVCIP